MPEVSRAAKREVLFESDVYLTIALSISHCRYYCQQKQIVLTTRYGQHDNECDPSMSCTPIVVCRLLDEHVLADSGSRVEAEV